MSRWTESESRMLVRFLDGTAGGKAFDQVARRMKREGHDRSVAALSAHYYQLKTSRLLEVYEREIEEEDKRGVSASVGETSEVEEDEGSDLPAYISLAAISPPPAEYQDDPLPQSQEEEDAFDSDGRPLWFDRLPSTSTAVASSSGSGLASTSATFPNLPGAHDFDGTFYNWYETSRSISDSASLSSSGDPRALPNARRLNGPPQLIDEHDYYRPRTTQSEEPLPSTSMAQQFRATTPRIQWTDTPRKQKHRQKHGKEKQALESELPVTRPPPRACTLAKADTSGLQATSHRDQEGSSSPEEGTQGLKSPIQLRSQSPVISLLRTPRQLGEASTSSITPPAPPSREKVDANNSGGGQEGELTRSRKRKRGRADTAEEVLRVAEDVHIHARACAEGAKDGRTSKQSTRDDEGEEDEGEAKRSEKRIKENLSKAAEKLAESLLLLAKMC